MVGLGMWTTLTVSNSMQTAVRVEIAGLGGTLTGDFLSPQLIYTGKTPACHPRNVAFPSDWHITHSPNHWSNEQTVNDYIIKIIVPYINQIRETIG